MNTDKPTTTADVSQNDDWKLASCAPTREAKSALVEAARQKQTAAQGRNVRAKAEKKAERLLWAIWAAGVYKRECSTTKGRLSPSK